MKKGKPFYVFCKITYEFCLYLPGLLNAFSVLQKVEFHNGETLLFAKWKTRSANQANTNENGLGKLLFLKTMLHFHWFSMLFLIGILWTSENNFLGYETQCYEGRKSGSANQGFSQSKWTPKVIFCKILVHFHWLFESFSIANSGNRECYLVTMKITISERQKTQKVALWESENV